MADVTEDLKRELARRTGTDATDWFLTLRARHGMQVVFEALRAERGAGVVVTQLLTCCTAVDPILTAGFEPCYADVSADTLTLDPESVARVVGHDTRAVVLQHTYGIIDGASDEALREAAGDALLVEDCAHCVGRMSRDAQGSPLADVSVHSFGVEKMLPTYFGGAVWVNPAMADTRLHDSIVAALSALPELDERTAKAAMSYHNQIRVLTHLPHGLSHAMRSRLEARGDFMPAVSEDELCGRVSHVPARANDWIAAQALRALSDLDTSLRQRSEAVAAYAELVGPGLAFVPAAARKGDQPLLHFPVYLQDPAQAAELIRRASGLGLYAVPWYAPVLYPGVHDRAIYHEPEALDGLPVTARLTVAPVGLPTDVTREQARDMARALGEVVGASR